MTEREKIENIKTKLKELNGGSKGGREARPNNNNNLIPQRRVERAPEVTQDELEDLEAALIYTIFDLPEGPLQDRESGGFTLGTIIGERQDVIGRLTTLQRQGIINIIEAEFGLRGGPLREDDEERMQEIINSLRESLFGVQGGKRRKGGKRKTVKANKSKKGRNNKGGMYRSLHKMTLGYPSAGHTKEIEEANAAKKIRDIEKLKDIRGSKNYVEVDDIDDLEKGATYFEFQGADAKPILKNLGVFLGQEEIETGYYGIIKIELKFTNHELVGFQKVRGNDRRISDITSLDNVFKVKSRDILLDPDGKSQIPGLNEDIESRIAEYVVGGRKSKRRRSIKKQKKTKMSRGKKGGMYRKSRKKQ